MAKPWCKCCSNDETVRIAEEIIETTVQNYYIAGEKKGPMCIKSIAIALHQAADVISFLAAKTAHNGGELANLPFEIVALANIQMMEEIIGEFGMEYGQASTERVAHRLNAIKEVHDADAAFDKAQKGG